MYNTPLAISPTTEVQFGPLLIFATHENGDPPMVAEETWDTDGNSATISIDERNEKAWVDRLDMTFEFNEDGRLVATSIN